VPSVLWHCWLGSRKGIRPVKTEWWDTGVVICLRRGSAHVTTIWYYTRWNVRVPCRHCSTQRELVSGMRLYTWWIFPLWRSHSYQHTAGNTMQYSTTQYYRYLVNASYNKNCPLVHYKSSVYKTHTQNCFTAFWILSGTTRVNQYQKKHSSIHTYRGHQSSLICSLCLLWSMASSLFNLRAWQSFSTISLQVFFGLPVDLVPSTSYSIHVFTQTLSSFRSTCPYHRNSFAAVPRLCPLTLVSLSTLHCPLKCHLIFLSYGPGLTSMHTTAVQSPSHYQWYILIGKQWYQLPELIPPNSNSGLHSCISISIHTQHVT